MPSLLVITFSNFKAVHPPTIPLESQKDVFLSKQDKSNYLKAPQLPNIKWQHVTFSALKFDKSIIVEQSQLLNILFVCVKQFLKEYLTQYLPFLLNIWK